jgi:hypothetical protein
MSDIVFWALAIIAAPFVWVRDKIKNLFKEK